MEGRRRLVPSGEGEQTGRRKQRGTHRPGWTIYNSSYLLIYYNGAEKRKTERTA